MAKDNQILELLNNSDEQTWHNPYDQEMREQESIRRGDIESLKLCWEEKYEGSIGVLAPDPLRSLKNIAIGVITLSSRSAIAGGVNPETAFSIVDAVIMKLEQSINRPESVVELLHDTQMTFAELVRDTNNNRVFNPIINKAKDYIFRNIHSKISVKDIAKWLNINPDYLSALFSRSENKTISEYIMEEKISRCCNMLKFSDYSIQSISAYFGFCSQSHFTDKFKSIMGTTPGQYRKQYGTSTFHK